MMFKGIPASESALLLNFNEVRHTLSTAALNQRVSHFSAWLMARQPEWLIDVVPSYHSVLIEFDPFMTDMMAVRQFVTGYETEGKAGCGNSEYESRCFELPVCYGFEEHDLAHVATHTSLSEQQVITLHQQNMYRVYAVGFAPGFAFLGSLPESLRVPRLATPRKQVPAGAVAIAEHQTAVYPIASPGGWNIIGRCPLVLFDPSESQPCLFRVGDQVRFKDIDLATFNELSGCRLHDVA